MKKIFFIGCSLMICMAVSALIAFKTCKQAVPFKPFYQAQFKEPERAEPGRIVIAWKMPEQIKKRVMHDDNFFKAMLFKAYNTETWQFFVSVTIKNDPVFNYETQEALIDRYVKQLNRIAQYLPSTGLMMKIVIETQAKTIEADQQDSDNQALKNNGARFKDRLNARLIQNGFHVTSYAFKKLESPDVSDKKVFSTAITTRHQINMVINPTLST